MPKDEARILSTRPDPERLLEILPRYDQAGPRYTSYPTAPVWKEGVGPDEARAAMARAATRVEDPLSLYVHVPFCSSLCHFCACNRVITKKAELPARYLEVIDTELGAVHDALGGATGSPRPLGQVHLGGGTPTHLSPEQLHQLFDSIGRRFDLCLDAWICVVEAEVVKVDVPPATGLSVDELDVDDFALDLAQVHVAGIHVFSVAAAGFEEDLLSLAADQFHPSGIGPATADEAPSLGRLLSLCDLLYDLAARADALMTFYESETNTLIARPVEPLRERTTYAVVVTRRLLDS